MALQKNPNAGKWKLPDGYKDLGWQLHSGNSPELKSCYKELGHSQKSGERREFDNSLYLYRCTDVVYICDICKIVHHVDMSD